LNVLHWQRALADVQHHLYGQNCPPSKTKTTQLWPP
jgi:hypothetical protein